MKLFHISVSVTDFDASVSEYSARLGAKPDPVVAGRYARWRTALLNFSISCKPGQPGGLVRHIGFEDGQEKEFREEADINGITWEYFPQSAQDEEIQTQFGVKPV